MKDNPYLLTDERCGVDFSAADEIALAMGFDGDSPCRTEAAVLYELNHNLSNGHVFLPRPKLLAATMELIGVDGEAVEKALDDLCERGAIVCRPIANVQGCYLRRMYEAEVYVAKRLAAACGDDWDCGKTWTESSTISRSSRAWPTRRSSAAPWRWRQSEASCC